MPYSYLNGGSIHVLLPGHMETEQYKPTHLQHPPRFSDAECATKYITLPTGRVVTVKDATDAEFEQFVQALLIAIYPSAPAARRAKVQEWCCGDWLLDARTFVLLEAMRLIEKRKCAVVVFVNQAEVESDEVA